MNCAGRFLDLSTPKVMAILNITPDSAAEVGRYLALDQALRHAEQAIKAGAAIIDVGGEATNPGVNPVVSLQEELDRVIPVVEALHQEFPVPISVDTSKPEVMKAALKAGMGLINDVRALREPGALAVAVQAQVPICLMHMKYPYGKPLQNQPLAADIVQTVKDFLRERCETSLAAGVLAENLIIDPGIGHGNFGKDLAQNLQLLNRLDEFQEFKMPVLVCVSRKTFLGELLNLPIAERLSGSLAATVIALTKGASIIRAHDVRETVEAVKIATAIINT